MLEIWYEIHLELIKAISALENNGSVLVTMDSGATRGEFNLNALANPDFGGVKDDILESLMTYETLIISKIQDSLKERCTNDITIPQSLVSSDICE